MRTKRLSLSRAVCAAVLVVLATGANAALGQSTWAVDTDGNWNVPENWLPPGVPNGNTVDVVIDDDTNVNVVVTLDINADVFSLVLDAGDALGIANSKLLDVNGGGVTNDGQITLDATSPSPAATSLRFTGSQTLSGSGEVVMSDDPDNYLRVGGSGDMLTHAAGHTIRGAGTLLANNGGMINHGTILAEGSDNPLIIYPGTPGFTNAGTLRAVGLGGLELKSGTITNTGYTIGVAAGSVVEINNVDLMGGHLAALGDGSGQILVGNTSEFDAVTIDAGTTVDQANGNSVDIAGGLVNHGTWNLNATSPSTAATFLKFVDSQTLSGSGEVVMSDDPHNYLHVGGSGDMLTHAAGHTIRGAGTLLANNGGMINHGTILAEGDNDLVIEPGTGGFTSDGHIEVLAGGTLDFTGTLTQTGGATVVDGDLTVSALLDIQGGSIGGSGTVTGQADLAGTLDPGQSVGTLTFERLSILEGAGYVFEIDQTGSDLVRITGLGDAFLMFAADRENPAHAPYMVTVNVSGAPALGDYVMFEWAGDDPLTDKEFAELAYQFDITPGYGGDWYYDTDTNTIAFTLVPEPTTLGLLALGGLAMMRRRRKQ